jgi:rhamnogalacturonan endolyase
MRRRTGSRKAASLLTASVLSVGVGVPIASAQVTITKSGSSWTLTNGAGLSAVFSTSGEEITNITLNGGTDLLNPGGGTNGSLNQEFSGTPFGAGAETSNDVVGPNNSYVDVWTTVNSTNTTVNPFTYAFHYVLFANDPSILVYETVTAPASESNGTESLGQGQFLFRGNASLFQGLYQSDTGPDNMDAVNTPHVPSLNSSFSSVSGQTGRLISSASYDVYDLNGSGITSGMNGSNTYAGDNGTNYYTKYDYSVYNQFEQSETMYGPQYAVSEVVPSMETLTGGPTKQVLAWTDPSILNMEFLSDHYGFDSQSAGAIGNATTQDYVGYGWYPTAGGETRLFGAYAFYIQDTVQNGNTLTPAQLNQNALNDIPNYLSDEGQDSELVTSGFVPMNSTSRGQLVLNAGSTVGWNANDVDDTAVLSEPHVNMQESTQGDQYWGQLSQTGQYTFNNVAPGTYRLTLYQLGQWGETRVDGVTVQAGQVNTPNNVTFTAENFNSTAAPIFTIGTPDRTSAEFLNAGNISVTFINNNAVAVGTVNPNAPSTNDQRENYGAYNYWLEEQELGTPGYINYNATNTVINGSAVAATNNTLDWPSTMWAEFDPGAYSPSYNYNGTAYIASSNGYTASAYSLAASGSPYYGGPLSQPQYVYNAGGAATYRGAPWTVNFAVTQTQAQQGPFIDLSVGAGALNASLTVTLNGHSESWSYQNFAEDDGAVRSADASFYQWAVFEFPTTDLIGYNTVGESSDNNEFTFSVSNHTYGITWDALRLEIDGTGANPTVTGWHDYTYVSSSGTTTPFDYDGQVASNTLTQIPEPTSLIFAVGAAGALLRPRRRRAAPTG